MQRIIFVCLGNICRSPLAEGIAKAYAASEGLSLDVESAGTSNHHVGEPPCENSIAIAKENGIDISHYSAQQFRTQDISKFDAIIALDRSNYAHLKQMGAGEKLYLLGNFGSNGEDVPDPYFFKGFEGFDRVFKMIESCVHCFFDEKIIISIR